MTRETLTQRASDLGQAIQRGMADRQTMLEKADQIAHAVVKLEGRLAEVQEMLAQLPQEDHAG